MGELGATEAPLTLAPDETRKSALAHDHAHISEKCTQICGHIVLYPWDLLSLDVRVAEHYLEMGGSSGEPGPAQRAP
jgi:hypothetical protein